MQGQEQVTIDGTGALETLAGAGSQTLDVVLAQGLLGALLLLSIAGNVALVWALVRCYRGSRGASFRHGGFSS